MSSEINYQENATAVQIDDENRDRLNAILKQEMERGTEQVPVIGTTSSTNTTDAELNMIKNTPKRDLINRIVDFSKENDIRCQSASSLRRWTKDELEESWNSLQAKKNLISDLVSLSEELKQPLDVGSDQLYSKSIDELKQMLAEYVGKSFRVANGMSSGQIDQGENLFIVNRFLTNVIEIGSVYADEKYQVPCNLKGLTNDVDDNKEQLTQILRLVAEKHMSEIETYLDPLVLYGMTMSQICAMRYARNHLKKDGSEKNADNSSKTNIV